MLLELTEALILFNDIDNIDTLIFYIQILLMNYLNITTLYYGNIYHSISEQNNKKFGYIISKIYAKRD